MVFSADLDMTTGEGSRLSVNGGKTNVNADYKGVGEQSGLFTGDGGLIWPLEVKQLWLAGRLLLLKKHWLRTDSDSSITRAGIMGVAAAPTLNDIQEQVTKVLIDKGMSEDVAN